MENQPPDLIIGKKQYMLFSQTHKYNTLQLQRANHHMTIYQAQKEYDIWWQQQQ